MSGHSQISPAIAVQPRLRGDSLLELPCAVCVPIDVDTPLKSTVERRSAIESAGLHPTEIGAHSPVDRQVCPQVALSTDDQRAVDHIRRFVPENKAPTQAVPNRENPALVQPPEKLHPH